MSKTKIIAMYLPQFHSIPENDTFWGKGFTDWVTVKGAKPLYENHSQPKVPLNENYYDLSLKENVAWQCKLAQEYGIYGFGIYHYWFNNEKNLLTKPAEIIRDNEDINMHYFFAWDNISWKRSWSNVAGNDWAPIQDGKQSHTGPVILIPYILGTERDWENHYNYLRSHFLSLRYIKKDNKPVFIIYHYSPEILEMCKCWDKLAQNDGFDGVYFIFRYSEVGRIIKRSFIPDDLSQFFYEPQWNGWFKTDFFQRLIKKATKWFRADSNNTPHIYDYDRIWRKIISNAKRNHDRNIFYGAFVSYDDSPRRGKKGIIVKGATPRKFSKYMGELLKVSESHNKEFVFLTAWNEWGEGAYLEPDTENGLSYLEALKNVVNERMD